MGFWFFTIISFIVFIVAALSYHGDKKAFEAAQPKPQPLSEREVDELKKKTSPYSYEGMLLQGTAVGPHVQKDLDKLLHHKPQEEFKSGSFIVMVIALVLALPGLLWILLGIMFLSGGP